MSATKLYDLTFLNKVSGGDMEFIKEMISTFRQVAPDYLAKSKDYLNSNAIDSLSKETHRFIPGVSFLGAKQLEEDLLKIEEFTKNHINLDQVPELMQNVEKKIFCLLEEFAIDFQ